MTHLHREGWDLWPQATVTMSRGKISLVIILNISKISMGGI